MNVLFRRFARLTGLMSALAVAGCEPATVIRHYQVSLQIEGDPGRPLAGAVITHGAERIGESDADGRVFIQAQGTEGQIIVARVQCPDGYRSPAEPLSIVLRRIAEDDRQPEYRARCEALLRTVVIAIRAEDGPNLPVLHLGREVARTDVAGAAHFMVKTTPDENLELTLDTSDNPGLRPQNPSLRLQVSRRDDVLVFSQKFELPPPPPRPGIRRVPRIKKIGGR